MSALSVIPRTQGGGGCGTSCGTSCGAGLEKVYPTTAVRWGAMRNIGEFTYAPNTVFRCGAKVVIQTDRGVELGEQVSLSCTGCGKHVSRDQIRQYIENSGAEFFRFGSGRILREATPEDVAESERLNAHVREDRDHCALIIAQLNLDMHVITAERLLGGERIIFYFRSEQRVDFRELVRALAEHHQTRIELRQVQARDEARLVADYEICGREVCCKSFLKKLRPVNMKMAKLQKSTLDPSKLSGRCGRLRCCLRYEHEGYEELDRKLARIGARVATEFGPGGVVNRQVLTQLLVVRLDDGREMTIPAEEIRGPAGPMVAPPPTAGPIRPPRGSVQGGPGQGGPGQGGPAQGGLPRGPRSPDGASEEPIEAGADSPPPADGERSRRRRRRRRGEGPPGPRPAGAAPAEPTDGDRPPVEGGAPSGEQPADRDGPPGAPEGARPRRRRRRGRRPGRDDRPGESRGESGDGGPETPPA